MSSQEGLCTPIEDWSSYLAKSKRHFQNNWSNDDKCTLKKKDFLFIRTIAKGGFSNVQLARKGTSIYAIKVMKNKHLPDCSHLVQKINEVRVLRVAKFPFIIQMKCYFIDSTHLYVVMPYIPVDLWGLLFRRKQFSEDMARFYSSQVLLAIEYLHYMGIVYRDIKTENILVNKDGYIKLIDFGFCKRIEARTYTMCGTVQYTAPEVMLNKGYGFAVDWWSFGVLLYELVTGYTPFFSRDERAMCEAIIAGKYTMNPHMSHELKNIIHNLLQVNPTKRLGNLKNKVRDIKSHRWFQNVDWMSVLNKQVTPPYIPDITVSQEFNAVESE